MLVLHDVTRRRIDFHIAARTLARPGLQSVDELPGIVDLSVELLYGLEHFIHGIPRRSRHEIRVVVRAIGSMPGSDELLVGGIVEVVAVGSHYNRADRRVAHCLQFAVRHYVLRADELDARLPQADLVIGLDDSRSVRAGRDETYKHSGF